MEETLPAKSILLMSGGIDSMVCAHLLASSSQKVRPVFIDFGQPTAQIEKVAAKKISETLGIQLEVISALGEAEFGVGELPGRNAFLIMTAMFFTNEANGQIVIGVHAGTDYYDCSALFINRMNTLVREMTDHRIGVSAPLVDWNKIDIVDYCRKFDLPIDQTYSCEIGKEVPCGKCASCLDRRALQC